MVALPPPQCGHGTYRRHLLPSRWRSLVGRFLERAAQPPRLLHSRDDTCVADPDERPLLPAAHAPSVLPLFVRDQAGKTLPPLWLGTAGGDRHPRLPGGTWSPPFA